MRNGLVCSFMVVLLVVLGACSSAPTPPSSTGDNSASPAAATAATGGTAPTAATSEQITLKMTVWDIAKTPYWKPMIAAYEAKHPNVKVEMMEISAADYSDKLNVMLSGGDDTDILAVKDIPSYSAMLTRNQIVPLNDYIKAAGVDLDAYDGAAEELTYNGSLYALPFRSDIWILFYNKDLFDKAGVPYPTNDMTWTQYDALARKLTHGSGADKVYGTHYHTWRSTVELPTVQDGKNKIIATDYTFMKPYYDMVVAMQKDGIIQDFGSLKAGNIHYSGVFKNQQVAMVHMGSWFISMMIQAQTAGEVNFKWGIAKFPHPEGVPAGTTASTLTSLALNANSKHKDAAWDFIKFYSGPEGAKVMASTGTLPAIRTPDVLATLAAVKGMPAESTEVLQTEKIQLELPMDPKVNAVEQILNEEHELIMTNSVSVDEGLAEMSRRVSEVLKQ